ncbi:MAG TPA: hypothetical protein VFE23_05045 [Usitatibacter sp.]|nr:hypothetical protein [Usitatibacter sp.]
MKETFPGMSLDLLMNTFRVASRELFNHYFRLDDPYSATAAAWAAEERFREVESVLFDQLVVVPIGLRLGNYGKPQERIIVKSRLGGPVPAMINREFTSGYWDYPVKEMSSSATLLFVKFFDWDQLAVRDNRYVCVQIVDWADHPEAKGKSALIETNLIEFTTKH